MSGLLFGRISLLVEVLSFHFPKQVQCYSPMQNIYDFCISRFCLAGINVQQGREISFLTSKDTPILALESKVAQQQQFYCHCCTI